MKRFLFLSLCVVGLLGCQSRSCPVSEPEEPVPAVCSVPEASSGDAVEVWNDESGLLHTWFGGFQFDVGRPESEKYLERQGTSPWLEADYISEDLAVKSDLPWAKNRFVRWLGATKATMHFPFYPADVEGDLMVEMGLRPKMNATMEVRFYRPDGNGDRVWSDPLTAQLSPGWYGYRWKVPREYLSEDGMQLMRVTFPGTFFDGDRRVAAKFAHIGFGELRGKTGRFDLAAMPEKFEMHSERILSNALDVWRLRSGDWLERFFVVPGQSELKFYTGPSSWLQVPGRLVVSALTDDEEDGGARQVVAEIPLKPGDCWALQEIPLDAFENQAVRLVFQFERDAGAQDSEGVERDDAWISAPELRSNDAERMQNAREMLANPSRIVVLAIDNLRADRLWNEEKRRAVPAMSRIADEGVLGILMGEGKFFVAMETSFLTTVPADVHNVREPGTHVRTMLTTIAEAVSEKSWKSSFYSTSSIIDSTHGFAQGFQDIQQLNKENILESGAALSRVINDIKASGEKTLFYVHLSELRLPHRGNAEKLSQWGINGYAGGVNDEAMNRVAVLRDPTPVDSAQFEALYDSELSVVDDAVDRLARELPENTLLVIYGTHGTSLGESTLGYEQGLTPWELLTPFVMSMPGKHIGYRREGVATAAELSAAVLESAGAEFPAGTKSVLVPHTSHPSAEADGQTAVSTLNWFYRIRREGVDTLFRTGLDHEPAHKVDVPHPVTKRAHRELLK